MVPADVLEYLRRRRVPFLRRPHPRAASATTLAALLGVSGQRVGNAVVVRADGALWMALVPATTRLEPGALARVLGVRRVELVPESQRVGLFPGCEMGAEPPFGELYGLPLVVDTRLTRLTTLVVRAGSHTEALRLRYRDLAVLEWPMVGDFAREGPARPVAALPPAGDPVPA
jgi:Ala-tRNA(Pro) deacylase